MRHYQVCLQTLIVNYLSRKKTGEYEMFLGSQEKQNRIQNPVNDLDASFREFLGMWSKYTARKFEFEPKLREVMDELVAEERPEKREAAQPQFE